jgi:hypothetical protein
VSIKIIGPSEHLADSRRACQRTVNMRVARGEGAGEDRSLMLVSTEGLSTFLTLPATIRGTYSTQGRWFVVAGDVLYEVYQDASYTSRGILATGAGYVSMCRGRDQLVIVDGPVGYVMGLQSNDFDTITDTDFRGSKWGEELDGYIIFVDPETDQFYLTALDDASTLDALDFSSADSQPDNIITHRVHKRELFLFGEDSTEVWVNSGESDFPLIRYNSTPIDIGIVGFRAAANTSDSLVFVGKTERGQGYVYEMQAHQPVRISTEAVETALASSTDLTECSAWSYHVKGAEFVGINAPGMDTTWVFDLSTRLWHERGELVDGDWTPFRADQVTHINGTHYATAGSVIYRLTGSNIAGSELVRERTLPHLVKPSLQPITYQSLELACQTGEGGTITLEISNDGGKTFGAPLLRSLGAVGRYMQRVRWFPLGTSFDRVFRIRCSSDVPLSIYSGSIEA